MVLNIVSCTILYAPYTWLIFIWLVCIRVFNENIYVKPFVWHTPSPFFIAPPRADLGSQRQKENLKALFLKMTKQTDYQYLAHDIFTGLLPNAVKFLTLVKDTIISEVNHQNLQFSEILSPLCS